MRYWVQLFTEFRTFTHTTNNIAEAYDCYRFGKDKHGIIHGQILDNEERKILECFGYD